jgi:hypothetical protein
VSIEVGKLILRDGLALSTGDQIADLFYATYCDPKIKNEIKFEDFVRKKHRDCFWVGNRKLWTPKGVYTVQDPEAIGRSQELDTKKLEGALKGGKEFSWGGVRVSSDGRVRFAPKGSYKLGEHPHNKRPHHTYEELATDGDVIAGYGPEGAKKLAEVSKCLNRLPCVFGLDILEGQEPEQRISIATVTDFYWYTYFELSGNSLDDEGDCYAFGVVRDKK